MIGVLVRLQALMIRGRIVRSIRLLRQPKYLVGAAIGAAWILLWVGQPLLQSDVSVHVLRVGEFASELRPAVLRVVGVLITVFLVLPWLLPWGRLGLPFREAELTLLLQAPVSRRQVIQYGLLKSFAGVLIGALIVSAFLGMGGPLDRLRTFAGTLMLFTFWDLHSKWRALFLLRQREVGRGVARLRRACLTGGVGTLVALLLVGVLQLERVAFEEFPGTEPESFLRELAALNWPPLLLGLTAPARWLLAPALAGSWGAFAWAALPAVALIAAQREIVLRTPARFEESALAQARDVERRKSPARRFKRASSWGRQQRVFPLPAAGHPATAVLWKNLMRVSRVPLLHTAGALAVVLLLLAVAPTLLRLHEAVYIAMIVVGLLAALVVPILGGMTWDNDLRTDLVHVELIRTWPLPARDFVAAQIASPAALAFLTGCGSLGLALAGYLGSRLRVALLDLPSRIPIDGVAAPPLIVAGVLPVVAGAALVSSAMQNLIVLLLPGWLAHGGDANKGVAAFGQRLLFSMGVFLGFLLALVPGALLVGLAVLAQWGLGLGWTVWMVPVWGVLAAAPLFVETWLLVTASARLWNDLDPSQEILDTGR
jgi:hypothetical protein